MTLGKVRSTLAIAGNRPGLTSEVNKVNATEQTTIQSLTGPAKRCLRSVIYMAAVTNPSVRAAGFCDEEAWGGKAHCNTLVEAGFLQDDGKNPDGSNWFQLTKRTREIVLSVEQRITRTMDDAMAERTLTAEDLTRMVYRVGTEVDGLGHNPSDSRWKRYQQVCARLFKAVMGRKPTDTEVSSMTLP